VLGAGLSRVVCVSVTEAAAVLARRLPYEHITGSLVATVRAEWERADAFVLICATGIAVRAVGPLLSDKGSDPAVVCVDDRGRHAAALVGGHAGGANDLAVEVAGLLDAEALISTATDLAGLPALDRLPGFRASGDVAGVTRRWLDGDAPVLGSRPELSGWPRPAGPFAETGRTRVTVTDAVIEPGALEVFLRPPSLVVGAGASTGAGAASLIEAADAALRAAGLHSDSVGAVATIDVKVSEPAIVALARHFDVPVVTFPAEVLAARDVPNPSDVVAGAVGTPSVAEAAALAHLVAEKSVSASRDSTVAVARRNRPAGHLAVVGLGPGTPGARTPDAAAAVRGAEVVIGYGPYVDQAGDLLTSAQTVVRSPIGAETERAAEALRRAAGGQTVALVCSGDAGVYAMASLVCELAPDAGGPPVTVVPGVTAALAAAAVLGAPLGHDHAYVSLSDLLTPWPVIERRLQAAAEGDFVVSLYNPRSSKRTIQLGAALSILGGHRSPDTPAAVVTDVGRPGQHLERTTLSQLDPERVGMLSLVVVGSSQTRWIAERMVTPRGYLA
jgi:cobalt-precorrin 5A hydrolase/precorrin-3B C17-methyltransferase